MRVNRGECRVNRGTYWAGPNQTSKRINILGLTDGEASVIVNALEAYGLNEPEGSDKQLVVDDLVMQITRVTGY